MAGRQGRGRSYSHDSGAANVQLTIEDLRCEYRVDPIGVGAQRPRLSWKLRSERRGAAQTAYRIRVQIADAAGRVRPAWDSGRVQSNQSMHVVYEGPELESTRRYLWQVRVWDENGEATDWSPQAAWEMGLLDPEEWEADWIAAACVEDTSRPQPAPMLRRAFALDGRVVSARLYATALGLYEAHINGTRVGDAVFTPGWTSYGSRLQYQAYDVTELLREGDNAIAVVLSDGWCRGGLTWEPRRNIYSDRLAFLAELRVVFEDGRTATIRSDDRWKASTGPIRMSDLYLGETYDARLEKSGWTVAGFDDADWRVVETIQHPRDVLVAEVGPRVRRMEEIHPVAIGLNPDGTPIVDFGQNMVGWVRLNVRGEAGDVVVLRHAEILDDDGNLYTENLRSAKQEDTYILKGEGEEVFEPHFTFHGFRYVSVEGYRGPLTLESLTGIVIHSDLSRTGRFSCSDARLKKLYENILWSQKGNFLDVPTDCPQRDERLGWTGDAQVFARTAAYNMDVACFFTKWLRDLKVDQSDDGSVPHVVPDVISTEDAFHGGATGWADAAVIVPWTLYLMYGDERILEEHYDSMASWIAYMRRRAGDGLVWRGDVHYGDWLSYRSNDHTRPSGPTDTDLIATAYFAYSTSLLAETARILGRMADVHVYEGLASRIREVFASEFVTPAGRVASNTQTAYVLTLAFDLLPEDLRGEALERLIAEIRRFDNHITTGFLGTPLILHVLSDLGREDVAYDLLMQDTYPSWLYPITKGATTIWEHWDGIKPDGSLQDPQMNSYNHYAYGAVGSWLYEAVAGIRPDAAAPGFRHVVIRPMPGGGLTEATAELDTMYGSVRSSWKLVDDEFRLQVSIPANATATVILPGEDADGISESAKSLTDAAGVTAMRGEGPLTIVETGSGTYEFVCRYQLETKSNESSGG